ncbi:CHAT domain-containing protein [Streptosporangium sp. KLBMP 9127]|nr:CHAT domain-containing protein [Streptosporangium sp. KLBMP 9127]
MKRRTSWIERVYRYRLTAALFRLMAIVYPFRAIRLLMTQGERFACRARLGEEADPALLDRIVGVSRRLVAYSPESGKRHPLFLLWLSHDLRTRFLHTSAQHDLDEAISAAKSSLRAIAPEDPTRLRHLAAVSECLALRGFWLKDADAREEAIGLLVDAMSGATGAIARERLSLLCETLRERVEQGVTAGLTGPLRAVREAVARLPPNSPTDDLAGLGDALCGGVADTGDRALVGESVAFARAVLAHLSPADPARPSHRANLAGLLYTQGVRDGAAEPLAESARLRRETVETTPADDPGLPSRLAVLGEVLLTLHDVGGATEPLDEAVTVYRRALELSPDGDPGRPAHAAHLSNALRQRYGRHGDRSALAESADLARQALEATPGHDPARPNRLNLLAIALWCSFEAGGGLAVLEEAVGLSRQAVRSGAGDDPDHPVYLANLSGMLNARYGVAGAVQDAREAADAGRRAAAAAQDGNRHLALSTLARALANLYRATGDADVLDDAVAAGRDALSAIPVHSSYQEGYRSGLAQHLLVRFLCSGNPADLDEAVRLAGQAVTAAQPQAPDRWCYALNLGDALLLRSVAEDDDAALTEAVRVLRDGAAGTPSEDPDRALCLSSLGGALWQRFHRTGDASVLDEGVEALTEAVAGTPRGNGIRREAHANLALLLWARFQAAGDPADLDQAVATARRVCADIPDGHLHRPLALMNLGEILDGRFQAGGDPRDRTAAVTALRQAVAAGPGEIRIRIEAGGKLADLAADARDWSLAVESLNAAVRLLPRLAPRHFRRHDQQRVLTRFPGLASRAAAAALHLDEPHLALELLEHGRGVLLSQALDVRGELTDLRGRSPRLAEEVDRLRDALDGTAGSLSAPVTLGRSAAQPSPRLGDAWDRLVGEIRRLPGMERFLLPPSADELTAIAARGPVAVVNTSRYRSDAILLTPAGVQVVPLPGLHPDEVPERVKAFGDAIEIARDDHAGLHARRRAEDDVRETLGWLWDTIAEPVLDGLGLHGPPDHGAPPPRMWWMPTGSLGFLPLHAAGHYSRPGETSDTVLDRVVCSYTPTLRSLARARSAPGDRGEARPLVVAVPGAAGHRPLPDVRAEADIVTARFAGARRLLADEATRERVMAEMASAGWVHFACHGDSDPADPSAGHLVLHDRPLSVLDIAGLRIRHGQFAMLSACGTAQGAVTLADESIHLAGAFQLAGYRHVIGTMWPIADDVAGMIATEVYATLHASPFPRTDASATALHTAVQHARRLWPHTPSMWTSWLHVGA